MLGFQSKRIEKLNPLAGMEAYKWWKNLLLDLNMTCLSIYINMQVIHFEENQVSQKRLKEFGLEETRIMKKLIVIFEEELAVPERMLKILERLNLFIQNFLPCQSVSVFSQEESEWSSGTSAGLIRAKGRSPSSTPSTAWLSLSGQGGVPQA